MSEFVTAMKRARRRSEGNMEDSIAEALSSTEITTDTTTTDTTPTTTTEKTMPAKSWSQLHIHTKKENGSSSSGSGETKSTSSSSSSATTTTSKETTTVGFKSPARRRRGSSNADKILSTKKDKKNIAWSTKFEALTKLSIVEQAEAFLMQFVMEFQGRFSEVTDLALSFQSFAGPKGKEETVQELTDFQCHQFLEKRGETLTVSSLRDKLRDIDIDSNGMIAFIEYLLFKYDKTLEDMFTESADGVDPILLAALHASMEKFKEVVAIKEKRMRKMEKLRLRSEKGGVLGNAAKHELECMLREDETERNRQEITAAAAQRKATRAVKNADKSDIKKKALLAEKKKQEEEEEKKKNDEKKRRQESRARLAAKAAMFGK